jgi:hypothetical protein
LGAEVIVKKELERRDDLILVQTQIIGAEGDVSITTFEVTGPEPGQFDNLTQARDWFYRGLEAASPLKNETLERMKF